MKKMLKRISFLILFALLYGYSVIYSVLPSTITMISGEEVNYPMYSFADINFSKGSNIKETNGSLISSTVGLEKAAISLFGIIPVKEIDVKTVNSNILICGGDTIGMKLNSPGLTVITFEEFTTRDYSKVRPYKDKNIQRGDIIVKVENTEITDVDQFIREIQKSSGENITLTFLRNGKEYKEIFTPRIDRNDGKYKLGIWVKNVTSGVGTITYIDKNTGMFGALGHGISDIDGIDLLNIDGGTAYKALILSAKKGLRGNPGELRGAIRENNVLGEIVKNTRFGVFGYVDNVENVNGKEYEICLKNNIKEGSAKILSTINGEEVKEYDIEIEKVNLYGEIKEKNMVIKVTDKELIEKTGGIVQGMSGSPIIQNGKIVGAVTHVLISDPTRGYGIFIENMLEEAS